MQHLFIRQCSALIETMLFCKKEQETRELDMCILDWAEQKKCGYVACVLGHQATMGDVSPFEKQKNVKFEVIAHSFAAQLESACRVLFSTSHLARSIFDAFSTDRQKYASATKLLSEEELTLNHLNKEEPNFDDVIEYLELVIHKTEQFLEQSA